MASTTHIHNYKIIYSSQRRERSKTCPLPNSLVSALTGVYIDPLHVELLP